MLEISPFGHFGAHVTGLQAFLGNLINIGTQHSVLHTK